MLIFAKKGHFQFPHFELNNQPKAKAKASEK